MQHGMQQYVRTRLGPFLRNRLGLVVTHAANAAQVIDKGIPTAGHMNLSTTDAPLLRQDRVAWVAAQAGPHRPFLPLLENRKPGAKPG
jgi:hypothetical protein